jgi:hypothetical protein
MCIQPLASIGGMVLQLLTIETEFSCCGQENLRMAHFERIRDVVSGPFSQSLIQQRTAAGWQLVSIEWRRELPGDEAPSEGAFQEEIPYGLRISDDCQRLEFHPRERMVLTQMMDLVVQDFPFSSIASDLNEKGFRTRAGKLWNQVSVFNMIPRLIEIGPGLFSTAEWAARRDKIRIS